MKKIVFYFKLLIFLAFSSNGYAQYLSENTISYMLTYEPSESLYKVWLVPNYSTPNSNNGRNEERGPTAQVSIRTPTDFEIGDLIDITGTWEKNPIRLTLQEEHVKAGLSPDSVYYTIGKAVSETNYGILHKGVPVALFAFKNKKSKNYKAIKILDRNDRFIKVARETLYLEVSSSFYSLSGQKADINSTPLEQFLGSVSESQVYGTSVLGIEDEIKSGRYGLRTYPNPTSDRLTLKWNASKAGETTLLLLDGRGKILRKDVIQATTEKNEYSLYLNTLSNGLYHLILSNQEGATLAKVIKK